MKELLVEQKAKAYEEALEKAKSKIKNDKDHVLYEDDIIEIFPELVEFKNERIRTFLHQTFTAQYLCKDKLGKWHGEPVVNILAWLEKKDEQKPILDVEIPLGAKDSDLQEATYFIPNGFHAEIVGDTVVIKQGEQKKVQTPQWMIDFLDDLSKQLGNALDEDEKSDIEEEIISIRNWLKGNPNINQKPAEWSGEDEKGFNIAIQHIENYVNNTPSSQRPEIWADITKLKSLKDRVQSQRKQEWSEEDEQLYNDLSDTYFYNDEDYPEETYKLMLKRVLDWMNKRAKSLRPQSTWRPSDEMLEALYRAIPENTMEISEDEMLLDKLYQGLKYGKVLSGK